MHGRAAQRARTVRRALPRGRRAMDASMEDVQVEEIKQEGDGGDPASMGELDHLRSPCPVPRLPRVV